LRSLYEKSHLAVVFAAIFVLTGCGQAKFGGSAAARVVKKESTDVVTAPAVTKSQDGGFEILDFKLASLDAPKVKIARMETFNSRLYLLLQCEDKVPGSDRCVMGGDLRESFALEDIEVRLLGVSMGTPLMNQFTYDLLRGLDFSEAKVSGVRSSGNGVDLGPLTLPPLVDGKKFVVVARHTVRIDQVEYASFRIFSPNQ